MNDKNIFSPVATVRARRRGAVARGSRVEKLRRISKASVRFSSVINSDNFI